MPSCALSQLQYSAASYQVAPDIGQSSDGRAYWLRGVFGNQKTLRNCATVTSLAAMAKVRPIRLGYCISWGPSVPPTRPTSVVGEPMRKSMGPGTTTIVWPWLLTYQYP